MSRLPRLGPPGIAQHVIQRGNNRQICFATEEDYSAYLHWLYEYSTKHQVSVHAWVLMTNHVHLLVTPLTENGVSLMMQELGRQYVRYFNHSYRRSGTLWEGRFKSCVVDEESYLLQCYRYIELNPVRANMVRAPGDYPWSSYQVNGLGKEIKLCTHHRRYLQLGENIEQCLENYRALFSAHLEPDLLKDIRSAVNQGMALGSDRFKHEIERLTGRRVVTQKRGAKRKSANDINEGQAKLWL